MKKLKQKYLYLESLGYEVVYLALQGSQNYNMEIYTKEYKSDIDCMAMILPKFEDFVNNKSPISTTLVLDNNEHINLKDIREMFHLFQKQNIQYLELLFTQYKIINKKYKSLIDDLLGISAEIEVINKKTLYNSIIGASKQKRTALCHPYPSIKYKIDKYGYDGKQLHHIIRLNKFIENLDKGLSFKQSLTSYDEHFKKLCMDAKLNKFTLDQAIKLADAYLANTESYSVRYENMSVKDNQLTLNKLTNIKQKILKQYFTEQLLPKPQEKLDINKYRNIYFISDTHFGHANIVQFEKRDIKMNIAGVMEHDEELIRRWNNKVKSKDLVFILGDFSFHKYDATMEILRKLNGTKVLIEGNHDCIYLENKKFDRSLFKEITSYKEIQYKGHNVCLMHYPIQQFKHIDKETNPYIHLHGHIHSVKFEVPRHSYNVGADINNYEPISFDDAIEKALNNNGGKINGTF